MYLGTSKEWSDWITPNVNKNNITTYFYDCKDTSLFEKDAEFTISFDVEFSGVTKGTGGSFRLYSQWCFTVNGSNTGWSEKPVTNAMNITETPADGVYHYTATGKLSANYTNATKVQFAPRADYWGSGKYRIRNVKLEKGNKVTDWSPAPEDYPATNEIIAKLNLAIKDGQGVINISGNQVTIDSDNFSIDENGNMTCNDANIHGTIYDGNGEILVSSEGVLTNLQFHGTTCHVSSMQSSQAGIFDTLGFEYDVSGTGTNTATQMLLFPKIPENFEIAKATLTIRHYTLNLWEPEGLYGFGNAQNLKLYRGSNLMYRDYDIYNRVYGLERTTELELIDVLGNDGYTPSILGEEETDVDEFTTVDISSYISNDSFLVLKSTNTIEQDEDDDTNFKNCALKTGLVAMVLDVYGYFKK